MTLTAFFFFKSDSSSLEELSLQRLVAAVSSPQIPVRPNYFLLFPLVVVGSFLADIKANGPQRYTVSLLGEPVLGCKVVRAVPTERRCDEYPSVDDIYFRVLVKPPHYSEESSDGAGQLKSWIIC